MEQYSVNIEGLAIGLSTFLIIGLFHPLVIKGEYYFGKKINAAFLAGGLAALAGCLLCSSLFLSCLLAIVAFSCFWSILEVNQQIQRVKKGWFPMNPKRRAEYEDPKENKEDKKEGLHVSQRTNPINQHINN